MKIAAIKTAIALANAKTHTIPEASAITGLTTHQLYDLEKRENVKFIRVRERQNKAVFDAKFYVARMKLQSIFTSLK